MQLRRSQPRADDCLRGRRALVTGASGGLGQAIVRTLSDYGAEVVASGRRKEPLDALASSHGAQPLVCDVGDRTDLERLLEVAGTVDILVSNAGIPASGPLASVTAEQVDRALDVNLRAPLLLASRAAQAMSGRGHGAIVVMSSVSAKLVGPSQALYGATKAGLRAATFALREDLHGTGVAVGVVLPGPISEAGMWADTGLPSPPGMERSPQDVADAVMQVILDGRSEVDVMVPRLRIMATIALVKPAWIASRNRDGAKEFAAAMTTAHAPKWQ